MSRKNLPKKRFTSSRECYWREMFNDFASQQLDHDMSGWSVQGLKLRFEAYCAVLEKINLHPGARVLDLGCGSGVYSRLLAERGFEVFAVDFAWKIARQAKMRSEGKRAVFLSGDACGLPFSGRTFDHVVCIGLFQSLAHARGAIEEIQRVLKPGGTLCLMTLNSRSFAARLERLLGREEVIMVNGQEKPRLNTYDPEQFTIEVGQAGFTEVKVMAIQIYPEKLNVLKRVSDLWNKLPRVCYWTARSFFVIARKGEGFH